MPTGPGLAQSCQRPSRQPAGSCPGAPGRSEPPPSGRAAAGLSSCSGAPRRLAPPGLSAAGDRPFPCTLWQGLQGAPVHCQACLSDILSDSGLQKPLDEPRTRDISGSQVGLLLCSSGQAPGCGQPECQREQDPANHTSPHQSVSTAEWARISNAMYLT